MNPPTWYTPDTLIWQHTKTPIQGSIMFYPITDEAEFELIKTICKNQTASNKIAECYRVFNYVYFHFLFELKEKPINSPEIKAHLIALLYRVFYSKKRARVMVHTILRNFELKTKTT